MGMNIILGWIFVFFVLYLPPIIFRTVAVINQNVCHVPAVIGIASWKQNHIAFNGMAGNLVIPHLSFSFYIVFWSWLGNSASESNSWK
jgi:hypothetical protein